MNSDDRTQLQQKIEATIQKTEEEIAHLIEMTQPIAPENSIGRISRMDAINNKSVAEATLRSAKRKLSNLRIALSKIESPDFGICTRCKNPIPPARLMYMPQSSRCVRCADR
ncbi:MAG: TraR/DksA C4-type zinc finger protein [Bacteroidota bacterium]